MNILSASNAAAEAHRVEPDMTLAGFTQALAPRLPDQWVSDTVELPTTAARNALHDRLWDLAHADWALGEFRYTSAGVLRGPAGRELLVLPRPFPHTGQYIVAPLLPAVFGRTTDDVEHLSPHGIAVSPDPARAAAAVTARLLPRYDSALRSALPDLSPPTELLPWGGPLSRSDRDPAVLRAAVLDVLAVTEFGADEATGLAEVLPGASEYVSGYAMAPLVHAATVQALLTTAGLGGTSLLNPDAPKHLRNLSTLPRAAQHRLLRQTAARVAEPPATARSSAARVRSAAPSPVGPDRPAASSTGIAPGSRRTLR
ncbi:hypothetical protein ACIRRH_33435 [Kitasatospora sp. NPDC101235]|uniref:hypothetical protein n=1 Tax=Kitasatospora sp. NPDC101235 TaxID=3364101 RepID=UPI00382367D0